MSDSHGQEVEADREARESWRLCSEKECVLTWRINVGREEKDGRNESLGNLRLAYQQDGAFDEPRTLSSPA